MMFAKPPRRREGPAGEVRTRFANSARKAKRARNAMASWSASTPVFGCVNCGRMFRAAKAPDHHMVAGLEDVWPHLIASAVCLFF